jgi:hypothetical protein
LLAAFAPKLEGGHVYFFVFLVVHFLHVISSFEVLGLLGCWGFALERINSLQFRLIVVETKHLRRILLRRS